MSAAPSPWYSHELRSEAVYDGTERQAVPEGRCHVLYVHIVVILALYSTPLLESLQGPHGSGVSP